MYPKVNFKGSIDSHMGDAVFEAGKTELKLQNISFEMSHQIDMLMRAAYAEGYRDSSDSTRFRLQKFMEING